MDDSVKNKSKYSTRRFRKAQKHKTPSDECIKTSDIKSALSTSEPDQKSRLTMKQEESLASMEALVRQSAKGIHVLFDNRSIASAMTGVSDDSDFMDVAKMKRIQEVMTQLISQNTFHDKLSFLYELDADSFKLLVRTYFHIVDGTVRANSDVQH